MNIEREILEMKTSLKRIETAIAGDSAMGTKGLVHFTNQQEARIIDLEKYKDGQGLREAKRTGVAMGAGVAGGFTVHGIITLLKTYLIG